MPSKRKGKKRNILYSFTYLVCNCLVQSLVKTTNKHNKTKKLLHNDTIKWTSPSTDKTKTNGTMINITVSSIADSFKFCGIYKVKELIQKQGVLIFIFELVSMSNLSDLKRFSFPFR